MKILITGPQGSGKTTQSELLAEYLGVPLLDIGEDLRRLAKTDTEEGLRTKEKLDQGQMAPDDIVGQLVRERIAREDCRNGFVMDGYPRTLVQRAVFDPKYDQVFYLEISDDKVKERLKERGREDDTSKLIQERLMLYHELTEPVLAAYQAEGILERVDATQTIDKISRDIRLKLTK